MKNNMMIHCGGKIATLDEVRSTFTPAHTRTHYPLAHGKFVDRTKDSLVSGGYRILRETHALAKDDNRYFGTLELANHGYDYGWIVGLRNSHDRTCSAGIVAGTRVFVCDNLAFSGEVQIGRAHTRYCERDLVSLTALAVSKLNDHLGLLDRRIEAYKERQMSNSEAHDLIIRSVDARGIVPRDIPHVLGEWRDSSHEQFRPRNAWSLFNAVTEVHKRLRPGALIQRGNSLHGVFDAFVGLSLN